MLLHWIKVIIRSQPHLMSVADLIRYTFTAGFGLMLWFGSLVALISIVLVRDNPLLIIVIFCLYMGIFFLAMLISFFHWRKYRNHYNKVFNK